MNYEEYDYYYRHEEFTQQDLNVLIYLLPMAEHYKWKFISNRLSKLRSKKVNLDFCYRKTNEMFNLPSDAGTNNGHFQPPDPNSVSGLLGTSIPYLCHMDEQSGP
ncbi:unnamed protein product [Kuraishia capsulata CBS 1993]|uniref:Uncharacterized protein n=1 Tax=Kuraishia capsulata CBS 1993 TaxID=1382522 RepID=W6MX85_9ASCO|nr:uncharacterized protein KUCA_T00004432001 [Kuraishia capsulata CBS 1993]CDK28450.1 unnamed protein product [Kuraishia capsulata CBS 1993]